MFFENDILHKDFVIEKYRCRDWGMGFISPFAVRYVSSTTH